MTEQNENTDPKTINSIMPEWVQQVLINISKRGFEFYEACCAPPKKGEPGAWVVTVPSPDGLFSYSELGHIHQIARMLEVFYEVRGCHPRMNDKYDKYSRIVAVFHDDEKSAKKRASISDFFDDDDDDDDEGGYKDGENFNDDNFNDDEGDFA